MNKTNVATRDLNPRHQGFSIVIGEKGNRGPELDIQGEILQGWIVIANYANTDTVLLNLMTMVRRPLLSVAAFLTFLETRAACGVPMNSRMAI